MNEQINNKDYIMGIFQTGLDFISATEFINGCSIRYDTISSLRYKPLIVNISFACEVLLKCYYFINFNEELKGKHNLFKIYTKIKDKNNSLADLILNKFNKLFPYDPILSDKFEETLKLSGNHFYIDRYLYELKTAFDFASSNNISNNFDIQDQQKYYQWNRYGDFYFLYILSNSLKSLIAEHIVTNPELTKKELRYIKLMIKPME